MESGIQFLLNWKRQSLGPPELGMIMPAAGCKDDMDGRMTAGLTIKRCQHPMVEMGILKSLIAYDANAITFLEVNCQARPLDARIS